MRARKGLGFRSTVGRGRDGDQEISQTRGPFFFLTALPPRSRKHRRIEYMVGVIRTNVITARFASMQRTCASKAKSIHGRS